MKRFLFCAVAVMLFAACSKDAISEEQGIQNIVDEAPATLTVGFEDDETRIQLNEAQKTVWTNGDLASVFYRSDANQKWQYTGETGERTGSLKRVSTTDATTKLPKVVVVYPYNESYYINPVSCNIEATMPAEQTYLKDSYGLDGNIMVSSDEFNQISLKSVYGWLKLQLTGNGEQIKSITVRGNSGEQMAGLVYIDSSDATITLAAEMGSADDPDVGGAGGNLVFEDTVLTEVTLNCLDGSSPTEKGVMLGAEATAFYIALPPQTFTKGITVEISDTTNFTMTQSTDKEVVIERNHIKPMAAFKFVNPNTPTLPTPANNVIWYTATAKVEPYDKTVFGATYVSNEWNSETGKGVITFSGDVTKIGGYAFYGYETDCNKLTSVTIPDSVTTIGYNAFCGCDSLTSVTIGNSVTTIGDLAFQDCDSLTSVTIPDSVTTIGKYAFNGCSSLESVTIPDSVKTIGNGAFNSCSSLTSVTIPDSVTTIGEYAFSDCTSLTSVTIGNGVTTIGDWAFGYCTSLATVYCKPTTPPAGGSSMFARNASGLKIYVPAGSGADYKEKQYWSEYKDYIFEDEPKPANNEIWYTATAKVEPYYTDEFGATYISNVWDSETGKGVITFSGDVTKIGYYAFYECSSLTSVTIPDSVKTIGDYAFNDCYSLTNVTIPDSVTTIGNLAFYDCSKLTSVTIGNSVTKIGDKAFLDCTSLTSATIGNSVTTIGYGAFRYCHSLTSVTIPDSVKTIGDYAFFNCNSLTSVTIPDSVTMIGDSAFDACGSLTSVTIGNSVTTIGSSAFESCTSLTSVTIGNSVTKIGDEAFRSCSSLRNVYCKPTTPPTGGSEMFYNNAAGRRIFVPASEDDGIINAYKAASYWSWYEGAIFEEE